MMSEKKDIQETISKVKAGCENYHKFKVNITFTLKVQRAIMRSRIK
ncbi:MAG: hypothetical protein KAJ10_09290 [Thermodesulfovibrionia bacterium]|nr:hypothetical protein [Thermodesulfovibrionia bacterium]